tara:strand:- start:645 stop:1019 length:375 start_codon:yes stop_codon:yes gene_type:complete
MRLGSPRDVIHHWEDDGFIEYVAHQHVLRDRKRTAPPTSPKDAAKKRAGVYRVNALRAASSSYGFLLLSWFLQKRLIMWAASTGPITFTVVTMTCSLPLAIAMIFCMIGIYYLCLSTHALLMRV